MSTVNVNRVVDASGGVLAPISSVMRNRIINGAMVIDQRNAGASTTSQGYKVDRWGYYASGSPTFNIQQNAGSVTLPTGFTNYLGATSTSAYSMGSTDRAGFFHAIEGLNIADLGWGTANAKTVTLSAWVRSSITGTFGGVVANSAYNRCYVFSYTISAANTWEYKTITIAGDTTGTWLTNNGAGINLSFAFGAGSGAVTTAGSWGSTAFFAPTGQVNVAGTNGATFYITGVQLEVGTQATSFEYRQYQQELALCQRYFIRTNPTAATGSGGLGGCYFATTNAAVSYNFPVTMRAAPTVTRSSAGGGGDTFYVSNINATSTGTSSNVNSGTTGMWQELNSLSISVIGQPVFYNGSLQLSAEL
jgi:hypothetical protein